MNIEERIKTLENKVAQLSDAFLNAQRQNVPVVSKVDDTANKVVEITPYTDSKTAYIGDTEVVFSDVPQGNLSVFSDKPINYSVERTKDAVAVTFDALDEVTVVSISIQ